MREQPLRIAGRLEATLRVPDGAPQGIAVIAHPLPTHGGTMRNPLIAAIARAAAERGLYALRFNFRGTEGSAGEFTGGSDEPQDLADAVAEARAIASGVPVVAAGFSFGALMLLRWLASGGTVDAYALLGLPLRSVRSSGEERLGRNEPQGPPGAAGAGAPVRRSRDGVGVGTGDQQELPPVPDGAFIVQGERDQFGSAAELRERLPRARVREVPGVDHFFVERTAIDAAATGPTGALRDRYREVAALAVDQLARDARLA